MYGGERPQDFLQKFEMPYKPMLDAGVKFYAALGNHDDPSHRFYKLWNMDGERYYTYTRNHARFFVLDSDYMDHETAPLAGAGTEGESNSAGRSSISITRSIHRADATAPKSTCVGSNRCS